MILHLLALSPELVQADTPDPLDNCNLKLSTLFKSLLLRLCFGTDNYQPKLQYNAVETTKNVVPFIELYFKAPLKVILVKKHY